MSRERCAGASGACANSAERTSLNNGNRKASSCSVAARVVTCEVNSGSDMVPGFRSIPRSIGVLCRARGILASYLPNPHEAFTRELACVGEFNNCLACECGGPLAGALHQPRGPQRQRAPLHPGGANRASPATRRKPPRLLVAGMVAGISRASDLSAAFARIGCARLLCPWQVGWADDDLCVGALSFCSSITLEFLCGVAAHWPPSTSC